MKYARNTLKKDKRLNIRISERDLTELQKRQYARIALSDICFQHNS